MALLRAGSLRATMLSIWCLLAYLAGSQADAVVERQSDSGMKQFHHRAYHNSIIVNNNGVPYLYIDGGELTTWTGRGNDVQRFDVNQTVQNFTTLPDHNTGVVSLGAAWTTEDVDVRFIQKPKDFPTFVWEALWPDENGNSFYSYNGGLSFALGFAGEADPKQNSLWQFTPSQEDGGEWALADPPPDSNFSVLTRTSRALQTSHNGLNFALGGTESSATDFAWGDGSMDVPGMVMFNQSSGTWYNISTSGEGGYTYLGTAREGAAHFVPSFDEGGFGPKGLLFVFGGYTNENALTPFDDAHFFDPATWQWKKQAVSGTPPAPASAMCVVGVQGDGDTYEIFLHGGQTGETSSSVAQGAVWSLSLPAFHWTRHNSDPDTGRFSHSCNRIASDSSQMFVVGGMTVTSDTDFTSDSNPDQIPRDPWKQGIGIYDLNELKWSDSFDPGAPKYVTPDVIKAYYRVNGTFPASWTQDGLEALFNKSLASTIAGDPSDPQAAGSSSDQSSGNGHDSTATAMIAGSIAGAVGGLVILLLLGWCLIRRNRKPGDEQSNGFMAKMKNKKHRRSQKAVEMDGSDHMVVELPEGQQTKEMPERHSWYQGRYKHGNNSSVYELYSPERENGAGSPYQQQEWPNEKRGVTAPPSLVHPAARSPDSWGSPV